MAHVAESPGVGLASGLAGSRHEWCQRESFCISPFSFVTFILTWAVRSIGGCLQFQASILLAKAPWNQNLCFQVILTKV